MFQFPAFLILPDCPRGGRKSHSEIPGSKSTCDYPGLNAACRILPQLLSQVILLAAFFCQTPTRFININDYYVSPGYLISDEAPNQMNLIMNGPVGKFTSPARCFEPEASASLSEMQGQRSSSLSYGPTMKM